MFACLKGPGDGLLMSRRDAGEIKQFWMSAVRDKAYVVFETMEAAEAARQALYSLQWPEGMRTSLRPKYILLLPCLLCCLEAKRKDCFLHSHL